jgi:acyl carrier protein
MTEQQIRAMVVEALEYSNVIALRDKNLAGDFLAGLSEVPLDVLDMDSLAEMEVCIAIEVNAGVSILPEQLRKIGTLGRLVALIQGRQ